MEREDTGPLHQEATDHYLKGEYRDAIRVWKRVLVVDPDDIAALEGVRMSESLAGGVSPELEAAASPRSAGGGSGRMAASELRRRLDEVEARIEAGDNHGAIRAAEILAGELPGDADVLSALARARLAGGDSDAAADACAQLLSLSPEYAEAAQLFEACRQVSPAESPLGAVGISPSSTHSERPAPPPPAPRAVDPAMAALRQRVDELLSQARIAASHGRVEEATGLLSRLLILDDTNQEALALEEELRAKAHDAARDVDECLNEGVRCLEEGRLEEARQRFLKVLENSPAHAEALDFLEKADARLARREQERTERPAPARASAHVILDPSPRAEDWKPDATTTPDPVAAPPPASRPEVDRAPEFEVEESAPALPARAGWLGGLRDSGRRPLLLGAAGTVVFALAAFVGWKLLFTDPSGSAAEDEAAMRLPTQAARAAAASPPAASRAPVAPAALRPGAAPDDEAARIARGLARGAAAFESADYSAAVLAYNEVLALDPTNETARVRFLEAGERYRRKTGETEKLVKGKTAFAAGEYESALRLFYRVPESVVPAKTLNRYKVAGWYNLGVTALRAADCAHAYEHFGEAHALDPADPGIREARALASGCSNQRKDRTFYDAVEAMPYRNLED